MPAIKLRNVTKRWGRFYAVDHLNLDIEDHSFVTLLGPSGCGKTTILRMIAGLETPTSGQIMIGDTVVFDSETGINIPANKRKVGFLFQNYALWPNMTVYQNIAFGLKNMKEEMHCIDAEAQAIHSILAALDHVDDIVMLINSCKDKNKKLDYQRACICLIDTYQISMQSAKTILGYDLQNYVEHDVIVRQKKAKLNGRLTQIIEKYKKNNQSLNDQSEIMENGKVKMQVRKLSREEVDLAVRRVARLVKISMFMDRFPAELSGGQQQRVAIARTLAPGPQVLFMDEPLSNLDAKLRLEMRYELQRLHVDTGRTFVYVTHDQMEAMTLATKICLINNGVLQQMDAPLIVYGRPENLFVADFVGNPSINFIEAQADAQNTEDGSIPITIFGNQKAIFYPNTKVDFSVQQKDNQKQKIDYEAVEKGNKDELFQYHIAKVIEENLPIEEAKKKIQPANHTYVIGVRPEMVKAVNGENSESTGILKGQIYGAMLTGMESNIKLRIGNYLLTSVVFGNLNCRIGEPIDFTFVENQLLLFDRITGKYLCTGSMIMK